MRKSTAMQIRAHIETAVQSLDDAAALEVVTLYPHWKPGQTYETGMRVQHLAALYRVVQPHTSQADWPPDVAVSLYTRIDETHAGTMGDPIPYDGNMALVSGLYYVQDGVVYKCTRDTVNAVYAALRDLVGLYVEEVSRA